MRRTLPMRGRIVACRVRVLCPCEGRCSRRLWRGMGIGVAIRLWGVCVIRVMLVARVRCGIRGMKEVLR